jgi:hypothetical protein
MMDLTRQIRRKLQRALAADPLLAAQFKAHKAVQVANRVWPITVYHHYRIERAARLPRREAWALALKWAGTRVAQ